MHSKLIDELKNELKLLAAAFVAVIIILKIAYYKESLLVVVRTAAALFWLFMLPGYAMMLYWREKLGFVERIIAGTAAAMAASGIAGYYLGLIGLKLQNQTLILPAAIVIVSFALAAKFPAREGRQQNLFAEKGLSKTQQ